MAPAIRDGGMKFQIWPNDHNPPHVHVFVGDQEVLINLVTDAFMTDVSAGKRRMIKKAYMNNKEALVAMWIEYRD